MKPLIIKCRDAVQRTGFYMLIAGLCGTGKTHLLRTVPNPGRTLVIDFEGGLRTVSDCDIDAAPITDTKDLDSLLDEIESGSLVGQYDLIFIDSITALAELVLSEQPDNPKEYMTKYRVMQLRVSEYDKRFRHMPLHVVVTAGIHRNIENGLYEIQAPGTKVSSMLGRLPDFVGATRVEEKPDGSLKYGIQFAPRSPYEFCKARDPHNALGMFENQDLALIFKKITDAETAAINQKGAA